MTARPLAERIREVASVYPERRSAVIPALHLAQEEHGGWLPPEAFREVAEALDVTPAYCYSIASFYDMFRLAPAPKTTIEVCTNIPCAARGATHVLEAFERELGIHAGATSEDGEWGLGTIECLGGCGWATVIAVNDRQRVGVQADDVPALVEELRGG
jgi:NADH:ubiquinone oxidoreductase subunit E